MNITVKDVPKDLHQRLKEAADQSGRSLNKMILVTLDRALTSQKSDRDQLVQRIQARRARMTPILDDEGLSQAIKGGRE